MRVKIEIDWQVLGWLITGKLGKYDYMGKYFIEIDEENRRKLTDYIVNWMKINSAEVLGKDSNLRD